MRTIDNEQIQYRPDLLYLNNSIFNQRSFSNSKTNNNKDKAYLNKLDHEENHIGTTEKYASTNSLGTK